MRVICITKNWNHCYKAGRLSSPTFLETCTVIGETDDNAAYLLEEYPHPLSPEFGWLKIGFIPLSDIDESEFERNYNPEKVK